ncbi:MAG TPA: LolA-like putative outer membrane lipoprotein chaperone [Paludibacter sp.]|nr:LolA-like putative outer membrane lipoprotein chaperone [Paludibacter sp.]HOS45159.1 LolA-like putative outer membrane lipoprotein chaperone [Paludibacter sp.]HPM10714.1 LolA-like putative outer membrane lipoprotein chaperone [Paludibacter sp.]
MIKYILSICISICSVFTLSARSNVDAEQLVDRWMQIVQSRGISAKFTIKSFEGKDLISQEVSGDVVVKGNQFYFDSEELSLWFNGTTQWVYFKKTREVNISTPTADELAQTNPMMVVSGYLSRFNSRLINQADVHYHTIEMLPKNEQEKFEKLIVKFHKKDKMLQSIRLQGKTPVTYEIIIINYQKDASIHAKMFIFDASKFEGVILNDLR